MISVCPFDGQEYETEEYGRTHPDAVLPCGCWINLHPDGNGGYVAAEDFQRKAECKGHIDCWLNADPEEITVVVEFHNEPMVLVRSLVKHNDEVVEGWVSKPKPVDIQSAILEELRLIRADQRREIRALRREVGAYLNDHTDLLGKIVDYYTPRLDADPEEEASTRRWQISELRKTGRFSEEEIAEMVAPVSEHSDFEKAIISAQKLAFKELAEEAKE